MSGPAPPPARRPSRRVIEMMLAAVGTSSLSERLRNSQAISARKNADCVQHAYIYLFIIYLFTA